MQIIDKYDYCQQCHLLKSDCRCDSQVKAVTVATSTVTSEQISTSTWTIDKAGIQKKVSGIVIKGTDLNIIKSDTTYLNRVKRELKLPAKTAFKVLKIQIDKTLSA